MSISCKESECCRCKKQIYSLNHDTMYRDYNVIIRFKGTELDGYLCSECKKLLKLWWKLKEKTHD